MNFHLGPMHADSFASDPKHLGFTLRRYHFVARMLRGSRAVLEVGCGDRTGAPIVRAAVQYWEGCDIDDTKFYDGVTLWQHDMLSGPMFRQGGPPTWSAIYALDVLEHIHQEVENLFFVNINKSLDPNGTVIIGTPSLESQPYASRLSKELHVNCKSGADFLETLQRHYHNVFLLGLNDYALHDGFDNLVHYRIGLCCGKK